MSETGGTGASGTGAPAGWYAEPSGRPGLRYWDGSAWTDHVASPGSPEPGTGVSTPTATTTAAYPAGQAAQPRKGMSGCLWAFLIGFAVLAVGVIALFTIIGVGVSHVVHHVAGDVGRPPSLPSGAAGYRDNKKQDQVADASGTAKLGSTGVTATNWSRTTAPTTGSKLICGDVSVHRPASSSDTPSRALQLAGNEAWSLQAPSGTDVSLSAENSDSSALFNALTEAKAGDFSGKVCFPDPGENGRYVVLWQPDLLNARRAVWLVNLTS